MTTDATTRITPANFMGRRELMKLAGAGAAALAAGALFNISNAEAHTMEAQTRTNEWDKVFPKSPNVDHQKVTFRNRYGITLAGDLLSAEGPGG